MNIDQVVQESRASQNRIELKKTLEHLAEINPKVIVEIGVHKGYSMEVWRKAFDPEINIGIEIKSDELDQTALVAGKDVVLELDSHKDDSLEELKAWLKGKEIDFLFIDGDHTYNGVARDFELYAPLVKKGGIIAFHDVALDGEKWRMAGVDVQRFWNEVIADSTKYYFFWDEIGKGTGTGLYYVQ